MNAGAEVLTWNAAFGVMAGYFWPELRSANPDWAAIAMAFQPAVLSRTAGAMLAGYKTLAPEVTASRFEDLTVIANWNPAANYDLDGYTLPPSGCFARTDDDAVVGGIFVEQFNGSALTAGPHYVVVERHDRTLTVRQPSGSDTWLTVSLPSDWDLSRGIQVRGFTRGNRSVDSAPVTLDGRRATFLWSRAAGPMLLERYEITLR